MLNLRKLTRKLTLSHYTDKAFTLASPPVKRKHKEARELFYGRIIIPIAKAWMRYVQKLEVVVLHHERIPADGGAMLAVNHTGYWDFVYGGIPAHFAGGRLVRFMAKKEIWDNKIAGPVMTGMRHIQVDRADGQASVAEAISRLKKGQLVGIFPEATISRSFEIKEFRPGAAKIAHVAGVPLIPITVWGSQQVWTKGHKPVWRPKNAKLVIEVGEPVEVTSDAAETTERLHSAMVDQLEHTRAEYVKRFGPMPKGAYWVPASMGGSAPSLEEATKQDRADQAARRAKREAAKAEQAAKEQG